MKSITVLVSSISLLSTATSVLGGCTHDLAQIARRNRPVKRESVIKDTWQDVAALANKTEECTPYLFAPIEALIDSYPYIWETANLTRATADDISLFESMNASIPSIVPKGTRTGDFTGVVYDYTTDLACWWSATHCMDPKISTIPEDLSRCNEPISWGYAMDDGPNCSHAVFYDYLREQNQKATMFYIGSNVMDWPLEAQGGLAEGHEICAHTWSHPYMTSMTNEEAFSELFFAKKLIKQVLGITVQCWRPPYGDVDDRIRWIAQALGMRTMMWEQDTSDWKVSTLGIPAVEANYNSIIAASRNGTFDTFGPLVESHELNNETMNLVIQYYPAIKAAFTGGVMPIGVCTNNTTPYLEGAGFVYPNASQWKAGTTTISLLAPTAVSTMVTLSFATDFVSSIDGIAIGATATSSASAVTSTTTATSTEQNGRVVVSTSTATTTPVSSSAGGGDGARGAGWLIVGGGVALVALGI